MHQLDAFDRDFLRLTLEIDKRVDGYIDAYVGPPELAAAVRATPPRPPEALLEDVQALQARIPVDDPARRAYLTAVLRAIHCSVRLLNGETIPYLEEVSALYDIQPQLVDEAIFTAAQRELDGLLPGGGDLAERMRARRSHYNLPQEKILPLLELARAETRRRTLALIDLPGDQGVEISLTSNQPWGAYNWYKGNGRSHIEFNVDTPISALGLITTFAHEAYPGHHTEHLLKEHKFVQALGYGEMGAALLHSPAAVIAEGIATTAVEIIFPAGAHHDWNVAVLLPAAGIEPLETAAQMERFDQIMHALRGVRDNAAILYHTGRLTHAQAIDYLQSYGLTTPARASRSASFITHPLFRAYIFTYTQGYDLLAQAGGADKRPFFIRCLTEQLLPSQLKHARVTGR